jgi:hypothetical protein
MHVKKGNSREARNCLRIYFFWDEEREQVVVGHLPAHLTTSQSESGAPLRVSVEDPLKSLADICVPDERSAWRVGGLNGLHTELARLKLTGSVPGDVRQSFETAKNVALYAWFVYRFHVVAQLVALATLERALFMRWRADGNQSGDKSLGLKRLLREARSRGWLRSEGFRRLHGVARGQLSLQAVSSLDLGALQTGGNIPVAEPTEEEISARAAQIDFVGMLIEVAPDKRNSLAHGTLGAEWTSLPVLGDVADAINRLFADKQRGPEGTALDAGP